MDTYIRTAPTEAEEYGLPICFKINTRTTDWGHEVRWSIRGPTTNFTCESHFAAYDNYNSYFQRCCLPTVENGFIITCKDTYGDGWHGATLLIDGNSYCGSFDEGSEFIDYFPNPSKQMCRNGKKLIFLFIRQLVK